MKILGSAITPYKIYLNRRKFIKSSDLKKDQHRSISDYISGMTDRFAIQLYKSSK